MVGTACSACAICQVWPPYSLQTMSLPDFPPLNALRFFEAAARHGSFAAAARELRVTPASVSYRVKTVERHLGTTLFLRFAHGVRLNPQGKAYLKDIQRIFADFNHATERHRHRRKTPLLKLVAIEVVAEKWLMPQLAHFKTLHPDIAIEFEVDHGDVDPDRRDFDVWIAFADEVPDTVHSEKLLEETLFPGCSPSLLQARGRPQAGPAPAMAYNGPDGPTAAKRPYIRRHCPSTLPLPAGNPSGRTVRPWAVNPTGLA